MYREILARNQDVPAIVYAEQAFLEIIQAFHIDRVRLVVRENAHPVVGNAKECERQQGYSQFTGCLAGEEENQIEADHEYMLRAQSDTYGCQ